MSREAGGWLGSCSRRSGRGVIALRLAHLFDSVVGLDPDAGMISEAARLAKERRVLNASWVQLRAEALPGNLGSFRAITFAASFHWMDRPLVAERVRRMLEPGGAVVQIDAPGYRLDDLESESSRGDLPYRPPPERLIDDLRRKYLGPDRRAGKGISNTSSSGENEVFEEAGFMPGRRVMVPDGRILEQRAAVDAAFEEPAVAGHGLVVGVVGTEGLLASVARGVAEGCSFYIASVSKAFTAMCVMIAAGQHALRLDDEIRELIPELPDWTAGSTLRHLLWHTAPLPDYGKLLEASEIGPHGVLTDELMLQVLASHDHLRATPGEVFAYSNTGYWLLAVALARATGSTLRRFADHHLFGPLGMSATWYRDDYRGQVPDLAVGHIAPGVPHPPSCFDRVGDGGVVSTLRDLALSESAVLRREQPWYGLVERISAPVPLTDGSIPTWRAGVVLEEVCGQHTVLVGGTFLGYRAFGARLPEKHLAVFALADLETANVRGAAFRVIEALIDNA